MKYRILKIGRHTKVENEIAAFSSHEDAVNACEIFRRDDILKAFMWRIEECPAWICKAV